MSYLVKKNDKYVKKSKCTKSLQLNGVEDVKTKKNCKERFRYVQLNILSLPIFRYANFKYWDYVTIRQKTTAGENIKNKSSSLKYFISKSWKILAINCNQ